MIDIRALESSIEKELSAGDFDAARPLVSLYIGQTNEERYICKTASIKCVGSNRFCLKNVSFERTHFVWKTGDTKRIGKFTNCVFSEADISGCVFDQCTVKVARVSPKDKYWWSDSVGSFDANYCDFNSCTIYPGDGHFRLYNSDVNAMSISGSNKGSSVRFEKCNVDSLVVSGAEVSCLLLRGKIKGLLVSSCKIETLDIDSEDIGGAGIINSTIESGKVDLGKTRDFRIQSTSFNSGLFSQNMKEVLVEDCPGVVVLHHEESNQYAFVYSYSESTQAARRDRYVSVCHAGYEFGYGSFMEHMRNHEDQQMAEFFSASIPKPF